MPSELATLADLPCFGGIQRRDVVTDAIRRAVERSSLSSAAADVAMPLRFGDWLDQNRRKGLDELDWTAPHFRVMQETLDRVTSGELRRVIFQVPIRHGKTEHNTYRFPTFHFARNPRFKLLLGSYNQDQANLFSRDIRKMVRAHGVAISDERDAAKEWKTDAGGGLRAVGAGTGVASVNADGIVIDDPIGSREEAESAAHRNRVFDWISNDLLARTKPTTWVILTMSRWHSDDPVGRLRDRQGHRWHVVDLPAEAEKDDPLGRALNAPLWPEERGAEWLAEKREELYEYGFASLLQGRPRPREGGMFKWDWWQLLDAVPAQGPMVRYWDLAGTQPKGGKHDPDFSVGALACRMLDRRTSFVDVERFRYSINQRDERIEQVAREDRQRFGNRVTWWIETEAGIAGEDRTSALVRRIQAAGLNVRTEHPTGSKVLRAEPLAGAVEAGNVLLCPGAWRQALRDEAADFPHGKHDDQIDACSGAFAKLATPTATVGFSSMSI